MNSGVETSNNILEELRAKTFSLKTEKILSSHESLKQSGDANLLNAIMKRFVLEQY